MIDEFSGLNEYKISIIIFSYHSCIYCIISPFFDTTLLKYFGLNTPSTPSVNMTLFDDMKN